MDIVKIDMVFINDMQNLPRTSIILQNLINMMNELGLVPITEGVETQAQYRALAQMGCRMYQGYLFARPMPVEEFEGRFLDVPDAGV